MARTLRLRDLQGDYINLLRLIHAEGQLVEPRGERTFELEDVTLQLPASACLLPLGIGRACNPAVGAMEALQLIGGFESSELVNRISPHYAQFAADEDESYWGAYGSRIGDQMLSVEEKLRADRDTRQAQVTLWHADLDNDPGHRDYPCTLALSFRIRDGFLHLTTTMRSNDAWLGLAYDAFQFTQLQLTLAHLLGVTAGYYCHHAISLHLYQRDVAKLEDLHYPDVNEVPRWLPTGLCFDGAGSFTDIQLACDALALEVLGRAQQGVSWPIDNPAYRWYHELLMEKS